MSLAVFVSGGLIAVAGIAFGLFPARYISLAEALMTRHGAKVIARGMKLIFGASLLAGAGTTRHSVAVTILGGLFVVVGLTLLLLPRSRFDALALWGLGLSSGIVRFASLVVVVPGAWLTLAASGQTCLSASSTSRGFLRIRHNVSSSSRDQYEILRAPPFPFDECCMAPGILIS